VVFKLAEIGRANSDMEQHYRKHQAEFASAS